MAYSLFGERPRAASLPLFSLKGLLARFAEMRRARARRHVLMSLLELDEHRLDDLGVNRQDLFDAMSAPGAGALDQRRARRAKSWRAS